MYFWNVKALASDLREDRVSPRDQMMYLTAWGLYQLFEVQNALWVWEMPTTLTLVKVAIQAVITVGGIVLCYRTNRGPKGLHFVERFICIGWPIRVQLTVLVYAVAGILAIIVPTLGFSRQQVFEPLADPSGPAHTALSVIVDVIYYLWVRQAIQGIARPSNTRPNGAP